jgi:NADPH-dependent curcumin reductase CurA
MKNRKVCLNQRPYGNTDHNTWAFKEEELRNIKEGELLIEVKYISLDPAMRGWLDDRRSYIPPVAVGDVMRAGNVGVVKESKNKNFKTGDWVMGWNGVQKYAITDGSQDHNLGKELLLPPEKFLSVLGMPGYTAYFGLLDIGNPKEGETLVVSGAAGAVGSIVGQIAKIKGLKVVGIAGGPEKCKYVVDELGFDACIDYKDMAFAKNMMAVVPDGVDVYFDNVGGDILDFMLALINLHARVVICGAISQYNTKAQVDGPSNYLSLLVNRARMEGFVVMDFAGRYKEAALQLGQWMMEGKLKSKEHIDEGIDNFPSSFDKLFTGDKLGKLILKV